MLAGGHSYGHLCWRAGHLCWRAGERRVYGLAAAMHLFLTGIIFAMTAGLAVIQAGGRRAL